MAIPLIERVVAHLDHPDVAVLVELHVDRVDDVWFRGDQFNPDAGCGTKCLQRRFRRLRGDAWQFALQRLRDGLLDRRHDDGLDGLGPARGLPVVEHRAAALVAALAPDSVRGDVAHHVVTVGGDPCPLAAKDLLDRERVVDRDLAAERDPRQLVAQSPGLNGVGVLCCDLAVALESVEEELGVAPPVDVLVLQARLQLFLRRHLVERNRCQAECSVEWTCERGHLSRECGIDALRQFRAVALRQLHVAARQRVLVAAATGDEHRDGALVPLLEFALGEARVVTAHAAEAQDRAVAGVAEHHCAELAVRVRDPEHGYVVVERAFPLAGGAQLEDLGFVVVASVDGEPTLTDRPVEFRGGESREGLLRDVDEAFFDELRVPIDAHAFFFREVEHRREMARESGGGVRVRRRDHDRRTRQAEVLPQALAHCVGECFGHAEEVGGEEERSLARWVDERQCLRVDVLQDSGRGLRPAGVAGETHGFRRRDFHDGGAGAVGPSAWHENRLDPVTQYGLHFGRDAGHPTGLVAAL